MKYLLGLTLAALVTATLLLPPPTEAQSVTGITPTPTYYLGEPVIAVRTWLPLVSGEPEGVVTVPRQYDLSLPFISN